MKKRNSMFIEKVFIIGLGLFIWFMGLSNGFGICRELIEMGTEDVTIITSYNDDGTIESVERYVKYEDMHINKNGNLYKEIDGVTYEWDMELVKRHADLGFKGEYIDITK